jgi:hypothetical protein
VFIMGPHRSGTTVFYRALLESGAFNGVTAYHVVYRDRLLDLRETGREEQARGALAAHLAALGPTRQYDESPVGPDVPEEYGHALQHQGRRPRLRRRNLPSFLRLCRSLQLLQDPERPLLLKNPFDTAHFIEITRMLPHARFVFMHRNPVEVIDSQVRAIRATLAEKNEYEALIIEWYRKAWESPLRLAVARRLYGPGSRWLVHQVRWNLARLCRYLVLNVDRLGDAAVHVRYTDLCARPDEVVGSVLDFCRVGGVRGPSVGALVRRRSVVRDPDVLRYERAINLQTAAYRDRFGV